MKRNLSLIVVLAILMLLVASVADAGRYGSSGGGSRSFSSPSRSFSSPSRSSSSSSGGGWFSRPSAPAPSAPAPSQPMFSRPMAPAPVNRMAAPASSTVPNRYGSTSSATRPVNAPAPSAADVQMNRKANMTNTNSANMRTLQRPAAAPANYNYQSSMSVRRPITDSHYYFSTAPQYRPSYVPTFILVGGYHRDLFYDPYYHNYGYYDNGGFYPYGGTSVGVTPAGTPVVVVQHNYTGLYIFLGLILLVIVIAGVSSLRRSA